MTKASTSRVAVIVPNWNGKDVLPACLNSLQSQSLKPHIVVVENGSTDGSEKLIAARYPQVTVLSQSKNLGFAGGVNVGITHALDRDYKYVALFNNDAVADKNWLKELVKTLDKNSEAGIATCSFLSSDGKRFDSTGELYTIWGLSYPRGREEPVSAAYATQTYVFGASGGASLYRTTMLQQIGLFDEKFFAYYEDVDLSFRAQLAGWKVVYAPEAIAYHKIGATSSRIKGFATYQTMKNLPMLFWKNVPLGLIPYILPRLFIVYWAFVASSILKGKGWPALKGLLIYLKNQPYVFKERRKIQKSKTVSNTYIWGMMTHDLPQNAYRLRVLRAKWWKLKGRKLAA